jgi:hypothetical protein
VALLLRPAGRCPVLLASTVHHCVRAAIGGPRAPAQKKKLRRCQRGSLSFDIEPGGFIPRPVRRARCLFRQSELGLPAPPSAFQLRIDEARLTGWFRRWERRHAALDCRRIDLRQDGFEPLHSWRERVAITVYRATHQAHDFSGARSGRGIGLNMASSRGKGESEPLTLGQALAAQVRIIAWCKSCNHRAEPAIATQVAQ